MIQVSHLTRYYGDFPALDDVSFEVREGEIIGLLGLNGAGKSTTLQILAGILPPSRGRVTFDGQDVTDNADLLKARIGFLPEEPPLYRDMRVSDFILYCASLKGMSMSQARSRLPTVLKQVGLEARANQLISTLSHGYKKRVGIAMAVIHDPKLIILDEPISGLDPKQIIELRTVIRRLGEGRAVLLSSHILSEIGRTCDRLLFLADGKLVAQGTPADFLQVMESDRMVLTVRGDEAAFLAWLQQHEQVLEADLMASPGDGLARIALKLSGDVRETLLPEVAGAGFGLRLVEEPERDLEDIFLDLTGGAA